VAIPTLPAALPEVVDGCTTGAAEAAGPAGWDLLPTDNIVSVTVRGAPGDVTLATKAGAPLDPEALRADMRELWHRYVASQLAVTTTPVPGGYALTFDVTPARRVVRVELDGMTRADVPRLAMLEGTLHDRGRLARLVASSEATLRNHGYLRATLSATTQTTCEGVVVRIAGSLGRRYAAGKIRVTGAATPVTRADLAYDFGHTNVPGGAYQKDELDAALDRILARERALGYFDATREVHGLLDERTGRVDTDVRITDGPRYRIQVVTEGGTPEMRAFVAAKLAPVEGTRDLERLVRVLSPLDKQLAKLGGHVVRTDEKLAAVYRVQLFLVPLAPAGAEAAR